MTSVAAFKTWMHLNHLYAWLYVWLFYVDFAFKRAKPIWWIEVGTISSLTAWRMTHRWKLFPHAKPQRGAFVWLSRSASTVQIVQFMFMAFHDSDSSVCLKRSSTCNTLDHYKQAHRFIDLRLKPQGEVIVQSYRMFKVFAASESGGWAIQLNCPGMYLSTPKACDAMPRHITPCNCCTCKYSKFKTVANVWSWLYYVQSSGLVASILLNVSNYL